MNVNLFLCTGYSGSHCEEDIDECFPNPCLNGGICSDRINGFKCLCPIGFSGKKCEVNEDDCVNHPCQNGGNCTDGIASFTCHCNPGEFLFQLLQFLLYELHIFSIS